ncbi:apyrase [Anaeramoeba flamelloides]|uniref:Apyrase n=1 Tax=Anaeramoeba flamelloides TaxID=1746091 RepID=A0AAV8A6G0_9EUKA|nr:apyrase [Anaeramoeba flamelloides]
MITIFSVSVTKRIYENEKLIGKSLDSYKIGIITDLDLKSKLQTQKHTWVSYYNRGRLKRNLNGTYSVNWDFEIPLYGYLSEFDRGMELSELINWNGMLLAFDDRTGIAYDIRTDQPMPKYFLTTGAGNKPKSFKSEWATIKDDVLYVGSLGKEFTEDGEIVDYDHCYVKKIFKNGEIEHEDWTDKYNIIRAATNSRYPGYQIQEAVGWSAKYNRWYFIPRRVSQGPYDEQKDELRGSNKIISVNSKFQDLHIQEIGERDPKKGCSSFKFIPGRPDEMVLLKTIEVNGKSSSYISVINYIENKILLPDTLINSKKYEGIEFLD